MGFLKVCFEVRGVRGEEIIEFVLFLLSNLVTDPSFMSILPSEFYPISWEVRDTPPSPPPPTQTHTHTYIMVNKQAFLFQVLSYYFCLPKMVNSSKDGKLLQFIRWLQIALSFDGSVFVNFKGDIPVCSTDLTFKCLSVSP